MHTTLAPQFERNAEAIAAEALLRSCVHCGFCNATCPTYQVLGDELDGPRGRIYLIKQMLEEGTAGRSTQVHLDRCLTCLNCETTCPSGVAYGKLVTIGRALVDERVERPPLEKAKRWLLREGLRSRMFAPLLKVAQATRALLPAALQHKLPARADLRASVWPSVHHQRKVLLLAGCVQPAMLPNINGATARVLSACAIETLVEPAARCCGALRMHMNDHEGGLADARRNIDAWWPLVASGTVEFIISNASACGLAIKQYADVLRDDALFADKAKRVSSMARDVCEVVRDLIPVLQSKLRADLPKRLAFHSPCTLQHGQKLKGVAESNLQGLGFDILPPCADSHLCCGSAGTYSVLQPVLAGELRERKLGALSALQPNCILSANVGCIAHLQAGTKTPVKHWIEVIDEALG